MVVEVEIKFVVEAKIFPKDFTFLDQAQGEGYQPAALAPEEKASPVRHDLSKPAEKFRGQLLEVKLGALENLKVKRIDFLDHWRNVAHNRHIDWRGIIGCLQFASQVTPSFCAKPLGDIIVKVCKVDFERGHWHSWDTLESFRFEAAEQRTIVRGEFFEHDQMCPELARQLGNVGCKKRHCRCATSLVHMALSSCTPDHDRAEVQESGPDATDRGGNTTTKTLVVTVSPPGLKVAPKALRRRRKVTISGSGFIPGKPLRIQIRRPPVRTRTLKGKPNAAGNFRVRYAVPKKAARGRYTVVACQLACQEPLADRNLGPAQPGEQ